ncbi:MAG TPA: PilZ domain-containing protein [Myxococcales bacterium]|jgi:hypothetical protein
MGPSQLDPGEPRRRHSRRAIRLPAQLTWHGQHFAAETENISPGGALLNAQLPAGVTEVVAEIELRTGRAVRVRAKVRWQRPSQVGIEFGTFLTPFEEA